MKIKITDCKRIVLKIGSSLVTDDGRGLHQVAIDQWTDQIVTLREKGHEIIIVSSGAVAEGVSRLKWSARPHAVHELQAAASVGQVGLVESYEKAFQKYKVNTSQILLTHEDLANRTRYLNARATIKTLINLGIIPIVNENDTVATNEIRFGDNDTLAALVTNLIDADLLIILTDQDGLYNLDPRVNHDAKLVKTAKAGDSRLEKMAGSLPGSHLGSGGMLTKIIAAKRAARSGAHTIIASGKEKNVLNRLEAEEEIGTLLIADKIPLDAKRQWLADHLNIQGRVHLDQGAATALLDDGKSLLPIGVQKVDGVFSRGDLIACVDPLNKEIARGLANYNSDDTNKILKTPSKKIKQILGYIAEDELIHRDNLVLT